MESSRENSDTRSICNTQTFHNIKEHRPFICYVPFSSDSQKPAIDVNWTASTRRGQNKRHTNISGESVASSERERASAWRRLEDVARAISERASSRGESLSLHAMNSTVTRGT